MILSNSEELFMMLSMRRTFTYMSCFDKDIQVKALSKLKLCFDLVSGA